MAEGQKPDSRGLRFVDINDFSPGIYDNSLNAVSGATTPGVFPAPPGAADAVGTYACMSLPNGGLGPGPALGGTPGPGGLSLLDMGLASSSGADITGLTNSFVTGGDELIFVLTAPPVAGNQSTFIHSYVVSPASSNLILGLFTVPFSTGHKNFCCFPFTTTIGSPWQPVVVLPVSNPGGASPLYVYPDPAAPTAFGAALVSNDAGSTFGHQGRIVTISQIAVSWPFATMTASPNELFSYTDPPQTMTWPSQAESFGPEYPSGYGALTSVSAGELFAIKARGGAVIIQGDLNNPTVTSLPSVKSTGAIYGRCDTDPNGTYYCAEAQGAWVWGGGNSSSKISGQLDDNFFTPISNLISDTTYYGFYVQRWSDWMLFSNNWVYNTTTNGWWRLANPQTNSFYWYVPSYGQRFMFAAPQSATSATEKVLFEFDREQPSAFWSWRSLPVRLPSEDRQSRVREIVLRASNAYGDSTPSIATTLYDDQANAHVLDTWTMTPGINTIQEIRLNAGVHTTSVALVLVAEGLDAAPVLHSISIGFEARQHAALA